MIRLKELLKEFNLKQKDLYDLIGVTRDVVTNIIQGRSIVDDKKIALFSKFFMVSSDYFLGLSNDGIYVKVLDKLYSINKEQFELYSSINMLSYVNNVRILNVSSLEDIEFINSNVPSIKLKKESI